MLDDAGLKRFNRDVMEYLGKSLQSSCVEVQDKLDFLLDRQGKLFRPSLVFLSSRICGGNLDVARRVAASCEMIHLASLVHDDIIDRASYRRGKETVASRFGEKTGVLIGDYLFSRAFGLLTPLESLGVLSTYTRTIEKMCEGEMIQMANTFNLNMEEKTYFRIIEFKTAWLLAASCKSGAQLSGAPAETTGSLSSFGFHIGRAFQMVDDILDYVAFPFCGQKPRGQDLREGIITLPLLKLLQLPEKFEVREKVKQFWRASNSEEIFLDLLKLFREEGGLEKALQAVEREINLGLLNLRFLPPKKEVNLLANISRKIQKQISREKFSPVKI